MSENKNLNTLQDEELDQVNGGLKLNNDLVYRGEKPEMDDLVFDPENMPDLTNLFNGGLGTGAGKRKRKCKKTGNTTAI